MEPTIVKFVGSYICYVGPDFMKAVQSMNPVMTCTQSIQMDRICEPNYLDHCPPMEPASWEVRWQL